MTTRRIIDALWLVFFTGLLLANIIVAVQVWSNGA